MAQQNLFCSRNSISIHVSLSCKTQQKKRKLDFFTSQREIRKAKKFQDNEIYFREIIFVYFQLFVINFAFLSYQSRKKITGNILAMKIYLRLVNTDTKKRILPYTVSVRIMLFYCVNCALINYF